MQISFKKALAQSFARPEHCCCSIKQININ